MIGWLGKTGASERRRRNDVKWRRPMLVSLVTTAALVFGANAEEDSLSRSEVKELIGKQSIEQFPNHVKEKFSPELVPVLLEILQERDDSDWWRNAVMALGVIGDERAVEPLIEFFEHGVEGEIDVTQKGPDWGIVRGLLEVHPTLGELAAQGSEKALDRLLKDVRRSTWERMEFDWRLTSPPEKPFGVTQMKVWLLRAALDGLRRSGSPKGVALLEDILRRDASGEEVWLPDEQYKMEVVMQLGRIGNGQSLEVVKAHYKKDFPVEKARQSGLGGDITIRSVTIALGWFGKRGFDEAVEYLKKHCDLQWLEEFERLAGLDEEARLNAYLEMIRTATFGLTEVRSEEAIEFLEELQKRADELAEAIGEPDLIEHIEQMWDRARWRAGLRE